MIQKGVNVAIIQARMSSTRLPGKVLLDIAGQPMLTHVVERTRQAHRIDDVLVATTTDPSDAAIEAVCRERDYACYRGSLNDVLDRYYQAARLAKADVIVRITADCPLIDPAVVDATISTLLGTEASPACDFAANRLPLPWPRTCPIGLDTEVCTFSALEQAWKEADQPYQREHVLPYLYEGVSFDPQSQAVPGGFEGWHVNYGLSTHGFRIGLLNHEPDYGSLRWTVDTPADLDLVRIIFDRFAGQNNFSWSDVLALFEREPALTAINAGVQHKTVFDVASSSKICDLK
jgi:spore coat polysaccharide biosynthesis protein SpsF